MAFLLAQEGERCVILTGMLSRSLIRDEPDCALSLEHGPRGSSPQHRKPSAGHAFTPYEPSLTQDHRGRSPLRWPLVHVCALLALTLGVAQCGLADDRRGGPGDFDTDTGVETCKRGGRCCECTRGRLKLLHVTRHAGLHMEVQATVRHLCCIDVQTFAFDDGVNLDGEEAGLNYNVHPHRARAAWDAHGQWHKFSKVLYIVTFI